MAENRKSFWTTVPGVISGVAAIVTGLGVLVPLMLGVGGKHTDKNATSQNPSSSATSPSVSESVTSTTGAGTTDTSSPSPPDSLGTTGTTTSPAAGALVPMTASPSTVSFGSVRTGLSSSDASITVTNPGGGPVTIDHVSITGSNATWFAISSTTCGDGATIPPNASCQVGVRFSPTSLNSASAKLRVDYHPPQSSFLTVDLSGTGALL